MLPRRTSGLPLAALLISGAAFADDSNFRPYIVGSRAAGMGGAFTALSDDGSGSYYNPGGLAFTSRSSISLSASVYGVVSGSYANALGPNHDFTYGDLNILPTCTSAIRKFGDPNPATGVSDNTLVLSVFVPDSVRQDDRDSIGLPQNAFFLSQNSQTLWIGGGYAHRFGRVGFGAVGYFLLGTATYQLDLTVAAPTDARQFAILSGRTDITTIGGIGGIGMRVDASDHLRFGLSAYSPELGTGSRRTYQRGALGAVSGGPTIVVVSEDHLDAGPTIPLRLQLGAAWSNSPLTLSADLIFLGPREVINNPELAARGLDRHITRNAVLNGSLGLEYFVAEKFPMRVGAFTDFAASPSPKASALGRGPDNTQHINRYGVTLSGGYWIEHVHTDLGVMLSYGTGPDLVPNNLDFSNLIPTDVKELNAYVFLATSYEF